MLETLADRIEKDNQITTPSLSELKELAAPNARITKYGSMAFFCRTRGRSAKETEIIMGEPTEEQKKTVERLPDYLKGRKLIRVDRQIGTTKPFHCRSYISADHPQIGYMWASTLFETKKKRIDSISIQIPEWPETKVMVEPSSGVNLILGPDYVGELKMSHLRLAMYRTKERGGLGLHAGSKVIRIMGKDGKLHEKGILLFGLSATGKTTLTCHNHWLDEKKGEGIVIRQDDIMLMQKDSSCMGTEKNFYVKTDSLEPENERAIYNVAISKNALLENVMVKPDGSVDFFDKTITSNGRAVVPRDEMENTDASVDLDRVDIVLFITRRNTIIPPVAKLDKERAAAFFMLGESMGSSASDVDPGKPKRVVGANPFIVGPKDGEGNRFYDIIERNPHVECYLLNTGMIGEGGDGPCEKITVKDSAIIIREIARGAVVWKKDPDWGYETVESISGVEMSRFHPERHYSKEQYAKLTGELRDERRKWLAQFENLYSEIRNVI